MKGITIALFSCMFLGLQPVFSKVLLSYMPPIVLAAITSFSAALLLIFILEIEHKIREIEELKSREVFVLVFIGLLSGFFGQLFFVNGLAKTTATNAVLLTRTNSLLIAIFGVMFLKEKLTLNHIVGSVIMFTGVAIIATKNFSVSLEPAQGDVLLIGAAVCWASANIIMKRYICYLPPEVIVIGRHAVAGIVLTSLTFQQIPAVINLHMLPYLLGLVILVIIVGQYLWYYSLEHTTAENVGLISLTIPFFGVLYSVLLLGEQLTPYQIVGGSLIIAGLAVVEIHLTTLHDIECRIRGVHTPHH
ncbi:MAG: EamA family transporter [Candidatus Altiarchaeales archaeon]|nr:EamA family transporter [Candidatus Altiarchaeales archaeon]MBD3416600.1 EamA family transporter [Candidatus Altiarchaeales archaeon]